LRQAPKGELTAREVRAEGLPLRDKEVVVLEVKRSRDHSPNLVEAGGKGGNAARRLAARHRLTERADRRVVLRELPVIHMEPVARATPAETPSTPVTVHKLMLRRAAEGQAATLVPAETARVVAVPARIPNQREAAPAEAELTKARTRWAPAIKVKARAEDLVREGGKAQAISRVRVRREQAGKESAPERALVRTAAQVPPATGNQVEDRLEIRLRMEPDPRRDKRVVLPRDKQAAIRLVLPVAARMVRQARVRRAARPVPGRVRAMRMAHAGMSGADQAAVEPVRRRVNKVDAGKNRAVSAVAVRASDPRSWTASHVLPGGGILSLVAIPEDSQAAFRAALAHTISVHLVRPSSSPSPSSISL